MRPYTMVPPQNGFPFLTVYLTKVYPPVLRMVYSGREWVRL